MAIEEQLTGLCADAVGRVAELPAIDAVTEDSGRQRLAAYYLYSALLTAQAARAGAVRAADRAGARRRADPGRAGHSA
jgi:hypothetical protein